jgi:serine/threonine protein kinase
MEYVDGDNLRQLLAKGPLPPDQALKIILQLSDGLHCAHQEQIVHRDIKPENILVNKHGQVKIADFGLSKLLGGATDSSALTGSQQAMGTVFYMAPEQLQKSQAVDHRADIYSLGVVFYEMLTGERPQGRFAPPSHKQRIDQRLDEVVFRALEPEPNARYQHISDLKSAVEHIAAANNRGQMVDPTAAGTRGAEPADGPPLRVSLRYGHSNKGLLRLLSDALLLELETGPNSDWRGSGHNKKVGIPLSGSLQKPFRGLFPRDFTHN